MSREAAQVRVAASLPAGTRQRTLTSSAQLTLAGPPPAVRAPKLTKPNTCAALVKGARMSKESAYGTLAKAGDATEDKRGTTAMAGLTKASSSDGTTSEGSDEKGTVRRKVLQKRSKHRAQRFLKEGESAVLKERSFLEQRSVTKPTLVVYENEVKQMKDWLVRRGDDVSKVASDPPQMDARLSDYYDELFFRGEHPNKGEKLLAGLLFAYPQYSKGGTSSLPRAWRSLKGWKRLDPGRSRVPEPRRFWFGVSNLMAAEGERDKAAFTLLSLCTYLRPGQLLALRRRHLIPPVDGITGHWTVLANPQEEGVPSKTGEYDVSIAVDSDWLTWADPLWKGLSEGDPSGLVFGFSYHAYVKTFTKAVKALGRAKTVPYQLRHSGPSADRAEGRRSLPEVKKRGCWKSDRSVLRYEKAGRLATSARQISPAVQAYLVECERMIAEIMLGRVPPVRAPA